MILLFLLLLPTSLFAQLTLHTPKGPVSVATFSERGALFVEVEPLLKALGYTSQLEEKTFTVGDSLTATIGSQEGMKGSDRIFFAHPPQLKEQSVYFNFSDLLRFLDLSGSLNLEKGEATVTGKVLSFVRQEVNGGIAFAIRASAPFSINPFFLSRPTRYVLDASPLSYPLATREELLGIGSFTKLRASQFQLAPKWTMRLVVEEEKPLVPLLYWEDGGRTLVVAFFHQVTRIAWKENEDNIEVTISFTGSLSISSFALSSPHRIVVDIASAELEGKSGTIAVEKKPLGQIRFSQFQVAPAVVRVVLDLAGPSQFEVLPEVHRVTVRVEKEYIPLLHALIVVDAGHGGEDAGALSPSGVREKDINLDIAQRLVKKLQEGGLQVLSLRPDDTFVPLYDRPKLANQAGAALFVSIHENALPPKPEVRGTEVYYYNDSSLEFAQSVSQVLAEGLPLPSRGVKKAGFVVIKYTKMPAILVEVAYLTNAQDEALLQEDSFRELVAEKLKEGIVKYLTEHPPTFQKVSSKEKTKLDTKENKLNEQKPSLQKE